MKKELENKLFEKYPKIFRQKDLSAKETAMCWGITCGDGWYELINALCSHLQHNIDNNSGEKYTQIEAVQVKEKLGGLRFYVDSCSDYQSGAIHFAERMSYKICEECGTTNNVTTAEDENSCKQSLCTTCRNK